MRLPRDFWCFMGASEAQVGILKAFGEHLRASEEVGGISPCLFRCIIDHSSWPWLLLLVKKGAAGCDFVPGRPLARAAIAPGAVTVVLRLTQDSSQLLHRVEPQAGDRAATRDRDSRSLAWT